MTGMIVCQIQTKPKTHRTQKTTSKEERVTCTKDHCFNPVGKWSHRVIPMRIYRFKMKVVKTQIAKNWDSKCNMPRWISLLTTMGFFSKIDNRQCMKNKIERKRMRNSPGNWRYLPGWWGFSPHRSNRKSKQVLDCISLLSHPSVLLFYHTKGKPVSETRNIGICKI